MNNFKITLSTTTDTINSIDVIEADDISKLLLQFTMLIIGIMKRINEDAIEIIKSNQIDDDIPF